VELHEELITVCRKMVESAEIWRGATLESDRVGKVPRKDSKRSSNFLEVFVEFSSCIYSNSEALVYLEINFQLINKLKVIFCAIAKMCLKLYISITILINSISVYF